MRTDLLIGLGAGVISAVVYASATTGPLFFRYVLFFLTPLAIALAGLGWGTRAASIAAITGGLVISLSGSSTAALLFIATVALPIVVLTHLAGLYRTSPPSGPPSSDSAVAPSAAVQWYPAGRLVVWAAVISGFAAVLLVLALGGGDSEALTETIQVALKSAFTDGMAQVAKEAPMSEEDIAKLSKVIAVLLPAAAAISAMASLLFNLWLAGRITHASGQLTRPWPDLASIVFPAGTALALALTTLASLVPGLAGRAGTGISGALLFAYLLLGLCVVHHLTRGKPWRPFALWALYLTMFILNSGVALIVTLLGISETFLNLRSRIPPPPPGKTST